MYTTYTFVCHYSWHFFKTAKMEKIRCLNMWRHNISWFCNVLQESTFFFCFYSINSLHDFSWMLNIQHLKLIPNNNLWNVVCVEQRSSIWYFLFTANRIKYHNNLCLSLQYSKQLPRNDCNLILKAFYYLVILWDVCLLLRLRFEMPLKHICLFFCVDFFVILHYGNKPLIPVNLSNAVYFCVNKSKCSS
jgi:hypothetical protein